WHAENKKADYVEPGHKCADEKLAADEIAQNSVYLFEQFGDSGSVSRGHSLIDEAAEPLEIGKNIIDEERNQNQIEDACRNTTKLQNPVFNKTGNRFGYARRIVAADLFHDLIVKSGVAHLQIGELHTYEFDCGFGKV